MYIRIFQISILLSLVQIIGILQTLIHHPFKPISRQKFDAPALFSSFLFESIFGWHKKQSYMNKQTNNKTNIN